MPSHRFSYLLTYRESDLARRQNLDYILTLLRSDPTLEVVLVEQDSTAHLELADTADLKYLFVENDGPFNKSWGLNLAAKMATCDRLIFADADILLSAHALDEMVMCMDKGADAINPYNRLVDLSEDESKQLLSHALEVQIDRLETQLNRKAKGQHPPFCGGAYAITRKLYEQCGGMDERFEGWGGEDDAMSKRLAYHAKNMHSLNQTAYHLWHKSCDTLSDFEPNYIRNFALLTMYYERGASFYQKTALVDAERNGNLKKHHGLASSFTPKTNASMVSCLCVTKGRVRLLNRAINCFLAQTYPNKELIVVTESDDHETHALLARVKSGLIQHHVVPAEPKLSLGALRNLSISLANGEFICQWDDDDWYHPERIAKQLESIQQRNKAASVLPRWLIHDTTTDKVYCSNARLWEGSLLCHKSALPRTEAYTLQRQGEDSALIESLYINDELAIDDQPGLYVYCVRGENTWDTAHFDKILAASVELDPEDSTTVRNRIAV